MEPFWTNFGSQNGAKINKNQFKIRLKFQSDFGVVPGPFLVNFGSVLGSLNPQKWCSRVGAVLFLRKSRFSDQIRFWMDIFMIFDGLGDHFGDHFGIKIASKNRSKNQSDFGSILEGFWLPMWLHFGPILAPKIDQESSSKKDRFLELCGGSPGSRAGLREDLIDHRT